MQEYELHPPHLISVATLPCESQNTENVTLQWDITKENCIRCIIASSKWTRVMMCLNFTYTGDRCYTAKSAWNKDSSHRWPASVAALIRWGGWSSYLHMCHSSKNLSANCIKIHRFLMKLQTKISLLLFIAHGVVAYLSIFKILMNNRLVS